MDENALHQQIGHRIRLAMVNAQMNQGELAEKVGMRPTTVSRHVNGKAEISAFAVWRYADALGVDPGWLMGARPKGFEPLTFWAAA